MPRYYAFDSSSDPETIRLVLWPKPDAAETIRFEAETIIEEDSVDSFPSWMHAAVTDKAKENALRDLGFFNEAIVLGANYEKRLQQNKANQGGDSPMHIRRWKPFIRTNLESRIN